MKEKEMIKEISKGNEEALSLFIDRYAGLMMSVIKNTLWKYTYLHDEVLNDSVLAIWSNISSYNPKQSSFKNWCATVARYRAIDALRSESRFQFVDLNDQVPDPREDLDKNLEVQEVFNTLSPEDAAIFRSIFIDGYDYEETAKKNNLSLSALYTRIYRGRQKLTQEKRRTLK